MLKNSRVPLFLLQTLASDLTFRRVAAASGTSNPTSPPISGIGRSIISQWDTKPTPSPSPSLPHLLNTGLGLSPSTIRQFWRSSYLHPHDFLQLAQAIDPNTPVVDSRTADFLFSLFRWSADQSPDFRHHPRSYLIMVSMLVRARRLADAKSILLPPAPVAVAAGAGAGTSHMFSEVIQGFVKELELEASVGLFDRARSQGLVPSPDCYRALLDLGIRMEKSDIVVRVYTDMVEVGLGSDVRFIEYVVGSLCKDGMVREAVNVLRQARKLGVEAGPAALTSVATEYGRKKDFDDMIKFLEEWGYIPDARVCNKMVSLMCQHLGTEEAWLRAQIMEGLGFKMDAITFGVLVCRSCTERKLTNSFVYLSECFARSIKPSAYIYNSLISRLFREGMHWCAKDTFEDMVENGVMPDRSTFRVLLAGYCKYRKFDDVKRVLNEMINRGVASPDIAEDALTKVFTMLGLDSFGVKVKRDNNAGLPRAEFFDSLGNGLYLETDEDKYDTALAQILDSGLVPDLDSVLLEECRQGDVEAALRLIDEVIQLGQNVTLSTYSELLKTICTCPTHLRKAVDLFDEMSELSDQLDGEIFNLLTRTLSKNGMVVHAKLILDSLFKRDFLVEAGIFSTLIVGSWKERNIVLLREFLELAPRSMDPLGSEDISDLVSFLCSSGMIKEMLVFLDNIVVRHPHLISAFFSSIVKELYLTGYTGVMCQLVEEILQRGLVLDHTSSIYLIEVFIHEGKYAQARNIIDGFLDKKIISDVNVFDLLISSLFRLKNIGKAMSLKESIMSSTQSDAAVSVYCALVSEWCKQGKVKEATIELQEMLMKKLFPNDNALNALIKGYCRENDMRKANELFCIMLRKHVDLSIQGYRSLVRQMCMHGKDLGAVRLLRLIQGNDKSQLLILYNILIYYLFLAGKSLLAESLVKSMRQHHLYPDTNTYNFLIYGFYKCEDVTRSISTLYTMIVEGLTPSNRSLRTMICYLCRDGKLDKALELSKSMESSGWKHGSVVQNIIAQSLLSHGKFSEAETFLVRIEEKGLIPYNIDYDILIKQFCLHGSITKAINLLDIMLQKGNTPSEMSYSLVIEKLCYRKLFDRALDLHAEMLYKNLKQGVQSAGTLIYGLCLNQRTDDARRILRQMVKIGQIPTHNMYNCVIDRYYTENNMEKAIEVLLEMQEFGHSPKFETHWSLISNLNSLNKGDDDGNTKGVLSRLLSGRNELCW